jgi:hypothetical protein
MSIRGTGFWSGELYLWVPKAMELVKPTGKGAPEKSRGRWESNITIGAIH